MCYFVVERVDDEKTIIGVIESLAANADPEYFQLTKIDGEGILLIARVHDDNGKAIEWDEFEVEKLYIEEGMLKHSDWGINTQIGEVGYLEPTSQRGG